MSDNLNEIFDVAPELVADTALTTTQAAPVVVAEVVDDKTAQEKLDRDFEAARGNITQMTNDVTEAAKSAILLAQSGDSPRAYEVVATMLTAIVNANKELVSLHKIKQDAAPQGSGAGDGGGVNIEKAVFVGRAADLLRELRTLQKETK
jgi:hypothetical protein